MPPDGRLLVVDDEPATRWALERALRNWWLHVCDAEGAASGSGFDRSDFDAVLLARLEPEQRTRDIMRELRSRLQYAPVILLGTNGNGHASAVRTGAFDILPKPLDPDGLVLALRRAIEWRRLQLENERLEQVVEVLRRRAESQDPLLTAPVCEMLSCAVDERLSLQELEDRYVEAVLRLTGGNKVRAAEILGIHRRTLYRRAERRRFQHH